MTNDLIEEIRASIDWTRSPNNKTSITVTCTKNLQDKWKADAEMIKAIDRLSGKRTMRERIVKRIMQAKKFVVTLLLYIVKVGVQIKKNPSTFDESEPFFRCKVDARAAVPAALPFL